MAADAVLKEFSIDLDLKRTVPARPFEVVDGDTGNTLVINITDEGEAVDLTDKYVTAVFATSRGVAMQNEDSGVTKSGGTVTIKLAPESFAPGMVECEIEIRSIISPIAGRVYEALVTSAKFNFICRSSIRDRSEQD